MGTPWAVQQAQGWPQGRTEKGRPACGARSPSRPPLLAGQKVVTPPAALPLCGGWGQPPHWDWTPENQAERAGTPEAQAPRVLHADAVGPVKGKYCRAQDGGARVDQHTVATMFDSSQYPYNCFNDDADDYPAGSSDEEKRLTRPAYR